MLRSKPLSPLNTEGCLNLEPSDQARYPPSSLTAPPPPPPSPRS